MAIFIAASPPIAVCTFFNASAIDWLNALSVAGLGMTTATLSCFAAAGLLSAAGAAVGAPAHAASNNVLAPAIINNLSFICVLLEKWYSFLIV
jgi:hypothetical protein